MKKFYSALMALFSLCFSFNVSGQANCNAFWFGSGAALCPDVSFTDVSTSAINDPIVVWAWDFGDGNVSTSQNPTHTYTADGTYVVCLNILTQFSCVSQYCDTVTINCLSAPTCTADFTYNDQACPLVSFVDGSSTTSGTIISWNWDFGDGSPTSQLPTPIHNYTANGTYVVCLTATGSSGCTDTYCDTVTISCFGAGTCDAGFSYSDVACPLIAFTDASTSNPGIVTSWDWDFGDGNTDNTPLGTTHTYTADGNYVVCLTITTSDSCTSTFCDTVSISCISACPPPTADWSHSSAGLTVDFTDLSTSSVGISSWNWSFGDFNTSTQQNPQHTYAIPLIYLVCLTVDDSCGTNISCDSVDVFDIGVHEGLIKENDVYVYPNPAQDQLNLLFTSDVNGPLTINITDINGRVVRTEIVDGIVAQQALQFNVQLLDPGVYLIQLSGEDSNLAKRFVKR